MGNCEVHEPGRGLRDLVTDRCGTWAQVVVGVSLDQQDTILSCGRKQGAWMDVDRGPSVMVRSSFCSGALPAGS